MKRVSAMNFYAYRMMARAGTDNFLLYTRTLFHQFLVDMYAKIESQRLLFIKTHQKELRVENYIHLRDSLAKSKSPNEIGKTVVLPSSFTGGPRYMHEKIQDAMTHVRKFGKSDLFITAASPHKRRTTRHTSYGSTLGGSNRKMDGRASEHPRLWQPTLTTLKRRFSRHRSGHLSSLSMPMLRGATTSWRHSRRDWGRLGTARHDDL